MCVCVCVCAGVCACVRVCVCVSGRGGGACVRAYACAWVFRSVVETCNRAPTKLHRELHGRLSMYSRSVHRRYIAGRAAEGELATLSVHKDVKIAR